MLMPNGTTKLLPLEITPIELALSMSKFSSYRVRVTYILQPRNFIKPSENYNKLILFLDILIAAEGNDAISNINLTKQSSY